MKIWTGTLDTWTIFWTTFLNLFFLVHFLDHFIGGEEDHQKSGRGWMQFNSTLGGVGGRLLLLREGWKMSY